MYEPGDVDVQVAVEDGLSIVRLLGEHDLATQQLVATKLATMVEAGNPLVFDMTRTRFIDSTVINAVIHARNTLAAKGIPVALVVPDTAPRGVTKLLELANVENDVPVLHSFDDAKQTLVSGRKR
jgi:anti-sigma B factor antagonist